MGADLGPDLGLCLSDRADVTLALENHVPVQRPSFYQIPKDSRTELVVRILPVLDTCSVHVG